MIARFMIVVLALADVASGQVGTFTRTGDMAAARYWHTATRLLDGRVLIAGGGASGTPTAELYDPATSSFTTTGAMPVNPRGHTATLLNDGRVLIAGGSLEGVMVAGAELYDPAMGTFAPTGTMLEAQAWGSASLLQNGRVLIAGGSIGLLEPARAELYDPVTGTFSFTSADGKAGTFTTTASLLPNGGVLLVGDNPPLIYESESDTFIRTLPLLGPHYLSMVEWQSAAVLRDGTVLITGGNDDDTCGGFSDAQIYDPSSRNFHIVGSMTTPRDIHTSTLLRDGTVLIAGGGDGWCGTSTHDTAELYDPETRSFMPAGKMVNRRSAHTATPLDDGSVLLAGGFSYFPGATLRSAELYRPATPNAPGRLGPRR